MLERSRDQRRATSQRVQGAGEAGLSTESLGRLPRTLNSLLLSSSCRYLSKKKNKRTHLIQFSGPGPLLLVLSE